MASASVATGHSTLTISVSLNSQNVGANTSSLHIVMSSAANSGFSGFNSGGVDWAVSVPSGGGDSGAVAFSGTSVAWVTYDTTVTHDGSGNYSQTITGSIAATGTTTFGGPASVGVGVTLPRIPKVPSAPASLTVVSNVGRTVTLSVGGSSDNGGDSITNYEIQSSLAGAAFVNQTSGSTGTRVLSLLAPGSYVFRVYATNARGNSATTSTGTVVVHAGGNVWNGTAWVPSLGVNVWNGSAWVAALGVFVWNGTSWVAALS